MHQWGDEWFEIHGDDLYNAINEVQRGLNRCGIGVCTKEKFGCLREDFLRLWDGGLYSVLFGHRARIGTIHYKGLYRNKKFRKFIDRIHYFIAFRIDTYTPPMLDGESFEEWSNRINEMKFRWKGLSHINSKIGLTRAVNYVQSKLYNIVYQRVCKKYPDIIDELVSQIDGYKMIKPGIFGNIDGEQIHSKYWTCLK